LGVSSLKKRIPNLLSLSRFFILGIIIWLLTKPDIELIIFKTVINNYQLIALTYLTGLVTDILDGFLARRWQVESKIGNILDHATDKLMLLPIIYLLIQHLVSWQLFFYLSLEFLTIIISVEIFCTGKVRAFLPNWPNWQGKISYIGLSILILAMLVFNSEEGHWEAFVYFAKIALLIISGLRIWSIEKYLRFIEK
jgi:cardiolipin synthase (CMP-forming)